MIKISQHIDCPLHYKISCTADRSQFIMNIQGVDLETRTKIPVINMKKFIKTFSEVGIMDVAMVGGKNSSLGEMFHGLSEAGVKVPDGFASTAEAFWFFIDSNQLRPKVKALMDSLDKKEYKNLPLVGKSIRTLLLGAAMPTELVAEIEEAYKELPGSLPVEVAVRSSATAEDLP